MGNGLVVAVLGLIGVALGSILTYVLGKSKSSGKVSTAEAQTVFSNMQELLAKYKIEVTAAQELYNNVQLQLIEATEQITELRKELTVAAELHLQMLEEVSACRIEIKELRLLINGIPEKKETTKTTKATKAIKKRMAQ